MKNIIKLIIGITLTIGMVSAANAQTTAQKIGTNPTTKNASALLELEAADKGVLMPRVALTATTTFGLTGGTNTAGMVVYNTTANITGTVTYPAYGTGLYTWDGSGWKGTPVVSTTPTLPQTVLVAQGDSLLTANNSPITLKLNSVPFKDANKMTILGDVFKPVVSGTYKIDAIVTVNIQLAGNANVDMANLSARLIGSSPSAVVLQQIGLSGINPLYPSAFHISYIGYITTTTSLRLEGRFTNSFTSPSTQSRGAFQVKSLQVQQLN